VSQDKHIFFVDRKQYDTEKTALTGLEIKQIAGVEATNQLFLESPGNDPDRAISDNQSEDMTTKPPKHFYVVPPATFGAQ
jgi:Multiubiquitin